MGAGEDFSHQSFPCDDCSCAACIPVLYAFNGLLEEERECGRVPGPRTGA